jgi:hypothetical protein
MLWVGKHMFWVGKLMKWHNAFCAKWGECMKMARQLATGVKNREGLAGGSMLLG